MVFFQDLWCGKNCVPDMKVLSGAGKRDDGSRKVVAGEPTAAAAVVVLAEWAAPMRLSPLAVPEELSPPKY